MFVRIVLIIAGIMMIYFGIADIRTSEKHEHAEIQPSKGQGMGMLILGILWIACAILSIFVKMT